MAYDYTPDELKDDLQQLGFGEDSQNALSQALGVHRVTVGHWLAGERRLPSTLPWSLKALAAKLEPAPRTPDELRRWMKRNAYTPNTLAEALEIDASTVRRWLSGERPMSLQFALALAAVASDEVEKQRRRSAKVEVKPGPKRSVLDAPRNADSVIEPIRFTRKERTAVGEAASAAGMQPRSYIKHRALEGLPL